MGPKKEAKAAADGTEVEGEDPEVVLSNYQRMCRQVGTAVHDGVVNLLSDEEKFPLTQLILDDEDGPLGPGGARALCTALLGSGPGMQGGPYKLLTSIRFWRTGLGDQGAACMAELLRLGGADIKLAYLEMLDNHIGPVGAAALGRALSFGNNRSLLTLKLDCNMSLGSEGANALCEGLRTNSTLKQLHLMYCDMDSDAGAMLGDVVGYARSTLAILNVQGNRLGGAGLRDMCPGLLSSRTLTHLAISDNMICSSDEDLEALEAFCNVLQNSPSLTTVDMMYNSIGEEGALRLQPALTPENARITEFLLDATLPTELFESLHRRDTGKKKGKKGKGKKKKK